MAKMPPRRTSNDRFFWITLGPKATVTSRRDMSGSLSADVNAGVAHRSDPGDIGQHREHRVHCDDADDANDDCPGCRHADISGTPPGLEPDAAACHADHDRKG